MFYLNYVVIALFSYLLGAIPFAYILVKHFAKSDITKSGSGNVGALNSYEVTGKRLIGIAVMLLDFLKGLVAVLLTHFFMKNSQEALIISSIFVVIGHNFNIFLGLKGGKGLSTAAGATAILSPLGLILWVLIFFIGKKIIRNDVHVGNIVATFMLPLFLFSTPKQAITITSILNITPSNYQVLMTMICFLIILKHLDELKKLIKETKVLG